MHNDNTASQTAPISWRVPEWFPGIDSDKLSKLEAYFKELLRFNKAINLVSPNSLRSADRDHFADCILACDYISEAINGRKVFDLGSGNGLPGIVLGIMFPEVQVVLVDSDTKKVEFIKHVIDHLDLLNVQAMVARIEELAPGTIECAVSRGFASLPRAMMLTRKLFVQGGDYFHMKGDGWATEFASIPSQLCQFWDPQAYCEYSLPEKNNRMAVVKTTKIAE